MMRIKGSRSCKVSLVYFGQVQDQTVLHESPDCCQFRCDIFICLLFQLATIKEKEKKREKQFSTVFCLYCKRWMVSYKETILKLNREESVSGHMGATAALSLHLSVRGQQKGIRVTLLMGTEIVTCH